MTEWEVVAEGLASVEGPVWGPDGFVLNVCSISRASEDWPTRGGDVTATHRERPLETRVVFNTGGIPAALAFGPDGCLYVTDSGRRSIVRVTPELELEDWVADCGGEPFNGTNDLSFDHDGNLFFSDPWQTSPANPVGGVYGVARATGEVTRIDSGMAFPNGVVVRDGRLYVAETYPLVIWVYDVTGPGRAAGKREFARLPRADHTGIQGPDGMAFDAEGNLYVAHFGGGAVHVFGPDGRYLRRLVTRGTSPTNVCFGGPALDELYVTLDDLGTLERCRPGATGYVLSFCPSRTAEHPWSKALAPF